MCLYKIDQVFSSSYDNAASPQAVAKTNPTGGKPTLFRVDSGKGDGAEISPATEQDPIEYFFASDASAIIEHTDRVLYLQDNDVASVKRGKMSIHRLKGSMPGDSASR